MARTNQHCSLELCVCVYLCVSRGCERKFWPGYVCRRAIRPCAQNQSVEPTESGQICNSCVRVHTYTHTNTRTYRHTHRVKHIMHMMQTNKHESRFSFPVSLCISISRPNTDTHTRKHSLPHRKLSFVLVKKQVAYSSFSSFQWGTAMCMKEA